MRLVTFDAGAGARLGVVEPKGPGDVIVDITAVEPSMVTLDDVLAADAIQHVRDIAETGTGRDGAIPVDEVGLLPPVVTPSQMLFVRANYKSPERSTPEQEYPSFFSKLPSTLVGSDSDVIIPNMSAEVDWEAELALVIGRHASHVPESDALSCVAGYTITDDVSARDIQFGHGQQTLGKNFRTFAPLGPWLSTPDELGDVADLRIRTWVNEEVMQDGNTRDMFYSVPEIISFLSSVTDLEPGDVIATGSPAGVGFLRNPPVYLQAGDSVRIEIDGIGTLTHRMVAAG